MKHLLIPILLISSSSFAAGIQKWVDEDGQIHYGDSPPAKTHTESVRVSRPPSNPGKPLPKFNPESEKSSSGETVKLPADEASVICDRARQDMSVIENNDIVRIRDQDGSERVMSQEEIEARLERAQKDIDDYCD